MSQKKRFLLRLDLKLYQVLEKWSDDELRSVNAQIEYLLTDAARKTGRWKEERQKNISELSQENTDSEDN